MDIKKQKQTSKLVEFISPLKINFVTDKQPYGLPDRVRQRDEITDVQRQFFIRLPLSMNKILYPDPNYHIKTFLGQLDIYINFTASIMHVYVIGKDFLLFIVLYK